jgi:hypothetical protein
MPAKPPDKPKRRKRSTTTGKKWAAKRLDYPSGHSVSTSALYLTIAIIAGDVADLRQYIYEQMGRIRTNALEMYGLYGNDNGHGHNISKSNGHN